MYRGRKDSFHGQRLMNPRACIPCIDMSDYTRDPVRVGDGKDLFQVNSGYPTSGYFDRYSVQGKNITRLGIGA